MRPSIFSTAVMPERIQLRRTKGWRKPQGAVVVARPTIWGNPWRVIPAPPPVQYGADWTIEGPGGFFCWTDERDDAQRFAVALYRSWLLEGRECAALKAGRHRDMELRRQRLLLALPELRGLPLACWCPVETSHGEHVPCHADVLLSMANGGLLCQTCSMQAT